MFGFFKKGLEVKHEHGRDIVVWDREDGNLRFRFLTQTDLNEIEENIEEIYGHMHDMLKMIKAKKAAPKKKAKAPEKKKQGRPRKIVS